MRRGKNICFLMELGIRDSGRNRVDMGLGFRCGLMGLGMRVSFGVNL